MMDNHECLRNEITRRKNIEDAKETAKEERRQERIAVIAARPNKLRECSHLGCSNIIDISTPALKRQNEALWSNCVGRNGRMSYLGLQRTYRHANFAYEYVLKNFSRDLVVVITVVALASACSKS